MDIETTSTSTANYEVGSNYLLNALMTAPAAISFFRGPTHEVVFANEMFIKLTGKKDVIGQEVRRAFPGLEDQGYIVLLDDVYLTGTPYFGNEVLLKFDKENGKKEEGYFNLAYQPTFNTNGVRDGVFVHSVDVTEQVLASKKIIESELQFRTLADSIQTLTWIANANGWIFWYNNRWYEYTGTTPEEMVGWGWKSVHHPDRLAEVLELWQLSIDKRCPFEMVFPIRGADNIFRQFLTRVTPIFNEQGELLRWVGTNTDIDEQRIFSEKLEENVKARTIELQQANQDMLKLNKEMEAFTYVSSHDLQEPLRKIQTFTSLIMDNEVQNISARGKEHFSRIQNAAGRMQKLIDDLLAYSRASTAERKFEIVDIRTVIAEIKEELREELQTANSSVEMAGVSDVYVIPFQFWQLMYNLIGNSLKFSRPGIASEIRINCEVGNGMQFSIPQLEPDKEYLHISVSDNGIGFDQMYSDKIFEVFQRLHAKDEYRGTGIGLAIVKKIIDNHNGVITATGEANKGATFDIYIPRH